MVRSMVFAIALTIATGALARADVLPEEIKKALEKADALELYSLDPGAKAEKGDGVFHDYKVLGKAEVKKETLAKLVEAFQKGVKEADPRIAAGCFRPRHGIRVKFDGKTYDLVICFECVAVVAYKDDKEAKGFKVSESPTKVFNDILKDAKVKLPKQPDEREE